MNDPTCTSEHRPVVLLHGTFSTVRSNFAAMVPAPAGHRSLRLRHRLRARRPAVGARSSAQEVAAFIDQVLAVTGAEQVDVIGFSQGGLVLRTALRLDGLAPKVATAVLIAPSFHGTTSPLLACVPAGACPACADQAAGSALLAELDAGSTPTATWTATSATRWSRSRDDTVVTPVAAQVPHGPADRVTSIAGAGQLPGRVRGSHQLAGRTRRHRLGRRRPADRRAT